MASEFELICRYFDRPTQHTLQGVGDDAALVLVAPGMELAMSTDMLVSGTHFFSDADPYQIGWKSLAVNLSDMAAMGALPKWATLAIALPKADENFIAQFADGFFACAEEFGIDLIGGDTTRGPLAISVQIMGEVPSGMALRRSGAKVGDEIWVSGNLGDAALALASLEGRYVLPKQELTDCLPALNMPQPRVALGLALRTIANSAIDISDGLLADLEHILDSANVGAKINVNNIPCSKTVSAHLADSEVRQMTLAGGDDYELCFTASTDKHQAIKNLSKELMLPLSVIGYITSNPGLVVCGPDNETINFQEAGFDHFAH